MVQLKTRRTALTLYAVLLVLPTVVLGGLLGRQIWIDYEAELEAVRLQPQQAADRLSEVLRERFEQLLRAEEARPFYHYARVLSPESSLTEELALQDSPLVVERAPRGLLAWFNYDLEEGFYTRIELFYGETGEGGPWLSENTHQRLRSVTTLLVERNLEESMLRRAARIDSIELSDLPLAVAAVHQSWDEDEDCLTANADSLRGRTATVSTSGFHLGLLQDEEGQPILVATRRVFFEGLREMAGDGFPTRAECLTPLLEGFALSQGFYVDPSWVLGDLPLTVANQVLGSAERFLPLPAAETERSPDEYYAQISLIESLGFEPIDSPDPKIGLVQVAVDRTLVRERFLSRLWRFVAMAAMLLFSLSTGMLLLLRSVNRELAQAEQTENFVAAVTHELRTPLSTIRLHGEMLRDGWISSEEQEQAYYERIVQETGRLGTLVERVLEKSRLSSKAVDPEPADLTEEISRREEQLRTMAGGDGSDLRFLLARGLPAVMVTPEAIDTILQNLVENARKYAPVDPTDPEADPIVVWTGLRDGRVVLEVADRGPGVPAEERERIFKAFHRVGNEATRTSTGTGLGLHLVDLHARAVGGRASVHPHQGGGALFRVAFQTAGKA